MEMIPFQPSTLRKPKRASIGLAQPRISSDPAEDAKVIAPLASAEMPKPICSISGSMNGTAFAPIRLSPPNRLLTRKLRLRNSVRSTAGSSLPRPWPAMAAAQAAL